MSAHMRRGDFALVGWVMENSLSDHLSRIKDRLGNGRNKLEEIFRRKNKNELATLPLENDPSVSGCLS